MILWLRRYLREKKKLNTKRKLKISIIDIPEKYVGTFRIIIQHTVNKTLLIYICHMNSVVRCLIGLGKITRAIPPRCVRSVQIDISSRTKMTFYFLFINSTFFSVICCVASQWFFVVRIIILSSINSFLCW